MALFTRVSQFRYDKHTIWGARAARDLKQMGLVTQWHYSTTANRFTLVLPEPIKTNQTWKSDKLVLRTHEVIGFYEGATYARQLDDKRWEAARTNAVQAVTEAMKR